MITSERYNYHSKEMIEDCMMWSGYSKKEIEERLINFIPMFYEKTDKILISVEEYNRRLEIQ